ncbi:hypothetical protein GCM10010168_35410 [Actinoplanes ianthinogenes]|uniref:GGDEF domain-containing protein n=1 Tax=Actinoplanes ianthinogenes TaxID=122358 RepID=A0ABM7M5S5_9ACTN|nr:hypothetical protein Aiant_75960 [Actinoplanes ianthinogenes]GGR14497.1 hypothetical protein GCM10010168_35410 [Actinoplanes ianthinogenes]
MLASIALAVFAIAVLVVALAAPADPGVLLWLAAPPATLIPVVLATRIARTTGFPRATRMFWAHLAVCSALAGIGSVLNAIDALGGPAPTQAMSPGTVAAYAGCVVALMSGMFRLPMGSSGAGDRLRIGLDAGTVLLAAAIFLWQFLPTGSPVLVGFTTVLMLVTVFAVAKVALAGHRYIDPVALRLFALGLLGGALIGTLQQFLGSRPDLNLGPVGVSIIMICATAAAEAQLRSCPVAAAGPARNRRPFSVLPYLAVVAVDGLLVVTCWPYPAGRAVVLAAVLLTAVVMWRQITAMRENTELVARLDHAATHDALTGLPNRALFTARMATALAERWPVSVALIDLDGFKAVNDTLGHGAGDVLLTTTAKRLTSCVRAGDTVARLGGDEFVVLMPGLDAQEAVEVAGRMVAALAVPVRAEGHDLPVRASIGIAGGDGAEVGEGELLRRADIAMYAAKHSGGSNVRHYTATMPETRIADLRTAGTVRQAQHAVQARESA